MLGISAFRFPCFRRLKKYTKFTIAVLFSEVMAILAIAKWLWLLLLTMLLFVIYFWSRRLAFSNGASNEFYTFSYGQKVCQKCGFLESGLGSIPIVGMRNKTLSEQNAHKVVVNLASSGNLFSGAIIRTFPQNRIRFKGKITAHDNFTQDGVEPSFIKNKNNKFDCVKWAVVTTIFEPPSEAVRRFLYRKKWCAVIVGDKGKPGKNYYLETTMQTRMVFLSHEDQLKMKSSFVSRLPWNSFARKNVGYLYAIAQGAKIIFDFDDDNILKFWIEGASPDPVLDIDSFNEYGSEDSSIGIIQPIVGPDILAFNPYPALGAPSRPCWPRGLPLHMIHDKVTSEWSKVDNTIKFGVLQSLADIQPDVDAIYRLTKDTPFNFIRPEPIPTPIEQKKLQKPSVRSKSILKTPSETLTPYNAQATLHFEDAFWGLYLPVTVAGRVSDILRSYIVQSLFNRLGINLGFLPRPIVVQDRNPHSYEADFNAEIPLYTKLSFLTSYLIEKYVKTDNYKNKSLVETIEMIWIDMYERGFVEEDDVLNVQEWMSDLLKVGYKFPRIVQTENTPNKDFAPTTYASLRHTKNLKLKEQIISVGRKVNIISRNVDKLYSNKVNSNKVNIISRNVDKLYSNRNIKSCDYGKHSTTFGCSGLHDGPRTDHPSTLIYMAQKYVNVGPRNPPFKNYPRLKNLSGLIVAQENPSQPLKKYAAYSTRMLSDWPEVNKNHYLDNSVIKSIDAFICSFPASMCQLWTPFNKTIVFLPAHRYNLGRCTEVEWKELDHFLLTLSTSKPDKGNTIAAASRYDVEYLKYYTGLNPTLISSYSGFYIDNQNYKPVEKQLLIFSHSQYFDTNVRQALKPEFDAVQVYEKYPFYTSHDIAKHHAVILLPYSVMSYKTTELYASAIPIFIPSPKFYMNFYDPHLKQYGLGPDRTSTTSPYCQNDAKLEERMRPLPDSTNSIHIYSPNIDFLQDAESEQYWIQFSDFYDWPHIQYFDSYHHLKEILLESKSETIHKSMLQEIDLRKQQVMFEWCRIINRINKYKVGK